MEDGVFTPDKLCFALALWNGRDPILKERLFGLTGPEGNHGEDVKEYYYHLDSMPTHSYMRMLYKYPQREYPYADLVATNRRRGRDEPEYELIDTGVFVGDRYFDVIVEYAKAAPDDILIRVSATNRGPEAAELHLLPTLWFRNEWSWGHAHDAAPRPKLRRADAGGGTHVVAEHHDLGRYVLACEGAPALLFAENETNVARLFVAPNPTPYVKDGINDAVVHGRAEAVNPAMAGTKVAAHYRLAIARGRRRSSARASPSPRCLPSPSRPTGTGTPPGGTRHSPTSMPSSPSASPRPTSSTPPSSRRTSAPTSG